MQILDPLADNCEWFSKNFVYNLDFIPDDKMDWKPAPTSKSALEICAEVIHGMRNMQSRFEIPNYEWGSPSPIPHNKDEAKVLIISTSKDYSNFLRRRSLADLRGDLKLPMGPFPRMRLLQMPVQDLIHHHGQIAYLQTMWGDTKSHFFEFKS